MEHKFYIDAKLYESIIDTLNELHFIESKGNLSDFSFYFDDLWLSDTAVIENLTLVAGQWDIDLVFALPRNPLRFIKRFIISYSDPKKAILYASLMRRQAAKDQRGTITLDMNELALSAN